MLIHIIFQRWHGLLLIFFSENIPDNGLFFNEENIVPDTIQDIDPEIYPDYETYFYISDYILSLNNNCKYESGYDGGAISIFKSNDNKYKFVFQNFRYEIDKSQVQMITYKLLLSGYKIYKWESIP